jgi:hypothetical protein
MARPAATRRTGLLHRGGDARVARAPAERREPGGREPHLTREPEAVSRARTRALDGARGGAEERRRQAEDRPAREVAAHDRRARERGGLALPIGDRIELGVLERLGENERRERAPRLGPHRGEVARGGGEGAEADVPEREEVAREVCPLDLLVHGPHELRPRRWREDRRVVADADDDSARARRPEPLAQPLDARELAAAHGQGRRLGRFDGRSAGAEGIETTKIAPWGSLSSMQIVPPCASTSRFTMDRPRPVPPYSRVDEESTW